MSGCPGSGKSTLAKALADKIEAVIIDHDKIKSFLLDSNLSFSQSAKLTYGLQWVLAEDIMRQNRSVIIDSACNYKETRDDGIELAKKYNHVYRYVECQVDDLNIIDERLQSRDRMRSQRSGIASGPDDPEGQSSFPSSSYADNSIEAAAFIHNFASPSRPESGVINIDSTKSFQECVHTVLKRICAL